MMKTQCIVVVGLTLAACSPPPQASGGDGAFAIDEPAEADSFLEFMAEDPGTVLHADEDCPMENANGDTFFHVTESEFPSHLFSDSIVEFMLTSTYGPGPDAFDSVVACVDGASGYLTLDQSGVNGMPMPDDPMELVASGSTGSDDDLTGGIVAVAVGVLNDAGQVGTYATTLSQVCDNDGGGCAQACADPIAPNAAVARLGFDETVCNPADVLAEDGTIATLGREDMTSLANVDGVVPVTQSCVEVSFDATETQTVRVVGSWVQDPACGAATCQGETCGAGHSYGVWVSSDGGATLSHLGMAQGGLTTMLPVVDPQAPVPPLVGEHFLAEQSVDTVVICRLGFEDEADHVAIDYVELCPAP